MNFFGVGGIMRNIAVFFLLLFFNLSSGSVGDDV